MRKYEEDHEPEGRNRKEYGSRASRGWMQNIWPSVLLTVMLGFGIRAEFKNEEQSREIAALQAVIAAQGHHASSADSPGLTRLNRNVAEVRVAMERLNALAERSDIDLGQVGPVLVDVQKNLEDLSDVLCTQKLQEQSLNLHYQLQDAIALQVVNRESLKTVHNSAMNLVKDLIALCLPAG